MFEGQEILTRLLAYDLTAFAVKVGALEFCPPLNQREAVEALNFAERLSRDPSDAARAKCLLICGLLWEHADQEWMAVPSVITILLSRIGLGPSMPMVDKSFEVQSGQLMPLGSFRSELSVTARCLRNEVTAGKTKLLLSEFQWRVWRAIDFHSKLGISAPTSAGKSYALCNKIVSLAATSLGTFIFVVPTISLIQQVSRDLRKAARAQKLENFQVLQSFSPVGTSGSITFFVLTQERAMAMAKQQAQIQNVRLVVVDEIQNIERVANEDDERSQTLYDLIQEVETVWAPERIVISGPKIDNIEWLSKDLFGPEAQSVSDELPPVVNITYAFDKRTNGIFLSQHVTGEDIQTVPINSDCPAFGRTQYGDPIKDFIGKMAQRLDGGTLVFSPTSSQATQTAIHIAGLDYGQPSDRLCSLIDYISESIHPNFALVESLKGRIGYHHGKMPPHARMCVERAFSDHEIPVLTCTTTLMQGVNLPAKNILALNPHLYTRRNSNRESISLTGYEFSNLRGRAGRLLKDFVGRAVVLDESSFVSNNIGLGSQGKTVDAGYGSRFTRHRAEVVETLESPSTEFRYHAATDLVVYIRQSVLRHGAEAANRLRKVGISLSESELAKVARSMEGLEVPRSVCFDNLYWDPLELDKIFKANAHGDIPSLPFSPFDHHFIEKVLACIQKLKAISPFYFHRYVDSNDRMLMSLAISAQDWCAEKPLKEMIAWQGEPPTWQKIDERVRRINSTVMYGLPKFLKPLSTIQGGDNPILSCMDLGAFHPSSKRLIELGLPRETAIKIGKQIRGNPTDLTLSELELKARRLIVNDDFNAWERIQVEEALG